MNMRIRLATMNMHRRFPPRSSPTSQPLPQRLFFGLFDVVQGMFVAHSLYLQ
jgi:hypothetical protein